MKLFYIANIRMPTDKAHGLQITKMCEAFAVRGLEVELIVPHRSNPIKEDVFSFYHLQKNFRVKKIYSFDFLSFEKINKFFIYVKAFLFALGVFFHVLLNPKKFDHESIFYLRDEFSPWLLAILNKKIFLEVHTFKKRFRYYKIFFSRISGLILITEKAREDFVDLGMKRGKTIIAPDAVDLRIFDLDLTKEEARTKLDLPMDKKIICYTGRFNTIGMDKGINIIMESLKKLNDESIIFIGVGGSEKDIDLYNKKIKDLGINNNAFLIGFKPHHQLAVYQKAADILLMPFPYNEHYAFYMSPMKMFEYMAAKRPIIATNLPSIKEVLNENSALFVEPDDSRKLAEGIRKVLDNEEFACRIADRAYKDVENYTWERRVEKIISFIKSNLSL